MNSTIFVLALCLTAVLAAPQFHDPNHYAQHAQSVELARQGQSARLENFGGSNTQQVVPSDDLCGLCQSSHSGSDVSHATASGVGFVVPVAGGESSSSTAEISSSLQSSDGSVYIPIAGGDSNSQIHSSSSQTEVFGAHPVSVPVLGGSESYTHQSESRQTDSFGGAHPVTVPVTGGSESYTQQRESSSSSTLPVVQHVVYGPSGSSKSYSHHSENVVQSTAPVVQVYAPSGGSESYSHHHSEKVIQSAPTPIVPIYAPSSGSESYHHSEKVVQSNAAPYVPVYTPSASEHFTQSRFSESGSTIPVATYSPSSDSSFLSHHSRNSLQQHLPVAVPIFPASTGASSHDFRSSKITQQQLPLAVPVYGGGSHSVHEQSRFENIKSTPITPIIYPVLPSGNSHSSMVHESHSSNHAAPQILYHSVPSASSYVREQSLSSGNFGGNVGVVGYPSVGSARYEQSRHLSNQNYGSTVPVIGSQLSSRFGSSSDVSSNLDQYRSESERLARLQAQNIQSSSDYKASSVANFGGIQAVPVSTGGHTKSWEKSSKWASESEYDHTGTTKTSGFLSTAEGEDETVNGQSSGYRAATTTIENDGKRSTYSIHTR